MKRYRCVEGSSSIDELNDVNINLLNATGLDVHLPEKLQCSKKYTSNRALQITIKKKAPQIYPSVLPDISNEKTKLKTGFSSIMHLLSYIIVLCDGKLSLMIERVSMLTWFEEWFMMFEYFRGTTISGTRAMASIYEMHHKSGASVLRQKMFQCINCQNKWPTYATLAEDLLLRNEQWSGKYEQKMIIFHYNTGIKIHKPSDSLSQRLTWSSYYASNIGRGGVHIQPRGWMGTIELYKGAMSDSEYFNIIEILSEQEEF